MAGKCWMQDKCDREATHGFYTPEGKFIGNYCEPHCREAQREYAEKLGENWTIKPEATP